MYLITDFVKKGIKNQDAKSVYNKRLRARKTNTHEFMRKDLTMGDKKT